MQLQRDREEAGQVTGIFLPAWTVGFSVLCSLIHLDLNVVHRLDGMARISERLLHMEFCDVDWVEFYGRLMEAVVSVCVPCEDILARDVFRC